MILFISDKDEEVSEDRNQVNSVAKTDDVTTETVPMETDGEKVQMGDDDLEWKDGIGTLPGSDMKVGVHCLLLTGYMYAMIIIIIKERNAIAVFDFQSNFEMSTIMKEI